MEGITSLLDPERLRRSCTAVRLNLSAFARKVRVHLVLEERFVCERLIRHSDPAIVAKVEQHQEEMQSLGDRVADFAERWISEVEIQKTPQLFVDETTNILELVAGDSKTRTPTSIRSWNSCSTPPARGPSI